MLNNKNILITAVTEQMHDEEWLAHGVVSKGIPKQDFNDVAKP